MSVDLQALLDAVDDDVKNVLAKNPVVTDRDELEADDLPDSAGETWFRVPDVVAVFIDLQASTKLSVGKHPASTAAIYRAAMKNVVKILHDFAADFIQVRETESSASSVASARWSAACVRGSPPRPSVEARWSPNEQEPIWAGKPVNYAAKAAQQADRGELIVTGGVWLAIEGNDYLTVSCGHGTDEDDDLSVLWEDVEIEKLTHDSDDAAGRLLKAGWCGECGPVFVRAILAGQKDEVRDRRGGVQICVDENRDPKVMALHQARADMLSGRLLVTRFLMPPEEIRDRWLGDLTGDGPFVQGYGSWGSQQRSEDRPRVTGT